MAFKIPNRDAAKEVSNEKYRKSASYDAILAYDKLVKIERGQLARERPQGRPEGRRERRRRTTSRSRRSVRSARRQGAARAAAHQVRGARWSPRATRYNTLFPNNPDEIDLRYQAAVIYYDRNHFVEAARRFGDIITKFPEDKRSRRRRRPPMSVLEEKRGVAGAQQAVAPVPRQQEARQARHRVHQARAPSVVEGSQYK